MHRASTQNRAHLFHTEQAQGESCELSVFIHVLTACAVRNRLGVALNASKALGDIEAVHYPYG
jgi:hypothetical protein